MALRVLETLVYDTRMHTCAACRVVVFGVVLAVAGTSVFDICMLMLVDSSSSLCVSGFL